MGNCCVGFAPVQPANRDRLVELMEGVEDIPGSALREGLTWDWESFGDYLGVLERRRYDIDLAAQVPHAALRVEVMGARAAAQVQATPAETAQIARLAGEAVTAGALGFTTSRTLNHRSIDGELTPSYGTAEDELVAVARAVGQTGRGVMQVVSDFTDEQAEFGLLRRAMRAGRLPLSISLVQSNLAPDSYRDILAFITVSDPPVYEPDPASSLAARAQRQGVTPEELAYDIMAAGDGTAMLYLTFSNYADGNLDAVREMLAHPYSIPGLSDGGAHVGTICDGSFPTTLLEHWTRDRAAAGLRLPFVVQRQARDTARAVGLHDRGVLAPGYRADINVIDMTALRLRRPVRCPAGSSAGHRTHLAKRRSGLSDSSQPVRN